MWDLMNAELQHMAELVIIVKSFLATGIMLEIKKQQYLKEIFFAFAPAKRFLLGNLPKKVLGIEKWIKTITEKQLKEVSLFANAKTDDMNRMSFANGLRDVMVGCQYEKSCAAWTKNWRFNDSSKDWTVYYHETIKMGMLPNVDYNNPADAFHKTLEEIAVLAERLDCTNFQKCFHAANDILMEKRSSERLFPAMPEENERLYHAATNAWVFGARGSWNDAPPHIAGARGLGEEYKYLTTELYSNIMHTVLYAVNEW